MDSAINVAMLWYGHQRVQNISLGCKLGGFIFHFLMVNTYLIPCPKSIFIHQQGVPEYR